MWPNRTERQRGFTLLEMLLAIAIFAVIGLASALIMDQVIRQNKVSGEAQLQLANLQRVMLTLERDFAQMVPRAGRTEVDGAPGQLFEVGEAEFESEAEGIRFYRLGWLNPQGKLPRGTLQQVVYRIKEQKLQRLHTLYPDPVVDQKAIEVDLLDGVSRLAFSFYIEGEWRTLVDGTEFPEAVAVEMELDGMGVLQRKFLLAEGPGEPEPATPPGSGTPAGTPPGSTPPAGGAS